MLMWQSRWKFVTILFLFLFWLLTTTIFSIYHLTVWTILTQYQKVRNQIDTIEKLGTKLKYGIKDKDQLYNLLLKE